MSFLADRTWMEVEKVAASTDLMLCMGSIEQHGPHLPLDTDTVIIGALAERWARQHTDRMVGPTMSLGASGEHADFPGTVSIGTEATTDLIVEAVHSCHRFRSVVVASWHGGNADALRASEKILLDEGRQIKFWSPSIPGDAHAGRTETSMMLAIAPHRVRWGLAEPGNTEEIELLMPRLRREGVRAVSPNGVLGDPTGANREEGEQFLEMVIATA